MQANPESSWRRRQPWAWQPTHTPSIYNPPCAPLIPAVLEEENEAEGAEAVGADGGDGGDAAPGEGGDGPAPMDL